MLKNLLSAIALTTLSVTLVGQMASAQEKTDAPREQRLADYLSGTQFVGKFTVDGMTNSPKTEAYTIKSCEKLPEKDMYRMTARIKYGDTDQEVPLDLKILWSGNTPVITLEAFWIPGMGTFDAHVLIRKTSDGARYAGTWQHGDKGGHLFGKIVPLQTTGEADDKASAKPPINAVDGPSNIRLR